MKRRNVTVETVADRKPIDNDDMSGKLIVTKLLVTIVEEQCSATCDALDEGSSVKLRADDARDLAVPIARHLRGLRHPS